MSAPQHDRQASAVAEGVAAELARQRAQPLEAGLYLVATPIGNLGDISLRALATLDRVDVIYCEDTRHSRTLLDHFGVRRPLRTYHEHNAEAERPRILAMLAGGQSVALISDAGTPLISDPGYKLVRSAIEDGFNVTAIPGASAVLAGLAVAGLPTDAFFFAGFLPPKQVARRARLAELAQMPCTLIFFESPARLAPSLLDMAAAFPGRGAAVGRELTKRFEEFKRGSIEEISSWAADAGEVKGEVVIVIGPPLPPAQITDEDIVRHLAPLLDDMSLRDAARTAAGDLGVSRSRVYDLGVKLKGRQQ